MKADSDKKKLVLEKATEEIKPLVGYDAVFMLAELVGRLLIPLPTLNEIEKIQKVKAQLEEAKKEYGEKLGKIYEPYGIKKELSPSHPKVNEIMEKVNAVFLKASSLELDKLQVYTSAEIEQMTIGTQRPFNFDELTLLHEALVKPTKK